MYCLQAVEATDPVLHELAATITEACIVPLGQDLSLLPMTDALFDAVTVAGAPELDGFWKAPAGFGHVLAACSATGAVAYVEAEYFGGVGRQAMQVWDAGKVVLGPLHLAEGEQGSQEVSPGPAAAATLNYATNSGLISHSAVTFDSPLFPVRRELAACQPKRPERGQRGALCHCPINGVARSGRDGR